jgi:hypothetical protein
MTIVLNRKARATVLALAIASMLCRWLPRPAASPVP